MNASRDLKTSCVGVRGAWPVTPAAAPLSIGPFSFCSRRGSCPGSGGAGFRSAVLRARLLCLAGVLRRRVFLGARAIGALFCRLS